MTGEPPRAIEWPATRAALRRDLVPRWSPLVAGIVCAPFGFYFLDTSNKPEARGLEKLASIGSQLVFTVAVLGLILGGAIVWLGRRRRKSVRRYPWTSWSINYVSKDRHEWVVLLDGDGQPVSELLLSTWPKDIGMLFNSRTTEIWFAGNPKKYGVVSRPGGGDVRYAYKSRIYAMPNSSYPPNNPNAYPPNTYQPNNFNAAANPQPTNEFHQDPEDAFRQRWSAAGPAPKPISHGAKNDRRYPSPRSLRRTLAFVVDWSLHVGVGAAVFVAGSDRIPSVGVVAVLAWLAASFINRVLIQAVFHTTIGKAVFDLRAITPDEGRYPSFGRLTRYWLLNLFLVIFASIAYSGAKDEQWEAEGLILRAVRRPDIKRNAHQSGPYYGPQQRN